MSRSISRRHRRTATVTIRTGTRRSPRRLVCERNLFFLGSLSLLRVWLSYVLSLILKRIFMLKCNLAMLRLTPLFTLLALPIAITRLLCYHKRERPPTSLFIPTSEAVVLSAFPIAWFFGFLYYTEVPSLIFVVLTTVAATQEKHWLAALVRHA